VRGYPRASKPGLVARLWEWMAQRPGDPGGVVEDIAEEACDSGVPVPWKIVEGDVARSLARLSVGARVPQVPGALVLPDRRAALPQGPVDPSTLFTFDNPHFLDLQLRNHHHFGARTFETWVGFHASAVAMASRRCEAILALDDGDLEDLADGLPRYEAVQWGALDERALRHEGCLLLSELARIRLLTWASRAEPRRLEPVRTALRLLEADVSKLSPEQVRARAELIDGVVSALTAVVFEGTGLHYVQDAMAGGHLRTDREWSHVGDVRHAHDTDNALGLVAVLSTRAGTSRFVAFGDTYLLSASTPDVEPCAFEALGDASPPGVVSACLVQQQRGLLVAAGAASLVDWALGGLLYDDSPADACTRSSGAGAFVCRFLPTRPIAAAGFAGSDRTDVALPRGDLPTPLPRFAYQSLVATASVDGAGEAVQGGARMTFLSELGSRANWMTSWHGAVVATQRGETERSLGGELGYFFHWRWAARFLVNAGTFVYTGLGGLGTDVHAIAGLGPYAGLTLLPEGWTKIPLDLTLSFRLPIRMLDSRRGLLGDAIGVDAYWIDIGLGLAFM